MVLSATCCTPRSIHARGFINYNLFTHSSWALGLGLMISHISVCYHWSISSDFSLSVFMIKFYFSSGWPGTPTVAQDGLKFMVLLSPQHPECWTPHLAPNLSWLVFYSALEKCVCSHWVNALAAEPEDLSSVPRTYSRGRTQWKEEN